MKTEKLKEILSLCKEEKLELVHTLCSEEQAPELTKEQLEFITEQLRRIDSGEIKLMDWDDVKKKYKRFEEI